MCLNQIFMLLSAQMFCIGNTWLKELVTPLNFMFNKQFKFLFQITKNRSIHEDAQRVLPIQNSRYLLNRSNFIKREMEVNL